MDIAGETPRGPLDAAAALGRRRAARRAPPAGAHVAHGDGHRGGRRGARLGSHAFIFNGRNTNSKRYKKSHLKRIVFGSQSGWWGDLRPGHLCCWSVLLCLLGLGIGLLRGNQPRPSVDGTWTSVLLVIAQALRLVAAALEPLGLLELLFQVGIFSPLAWQNPRFAIDLSDPPTHIFDICRGLGTGQRSRAIGAWQVGLWAHAVLDGHVPHPQASQLCLRCPAGSRHRTHRPSSGALLYPLSRLPLHI